MKDYKEMSRSVLSRRDQYYARRTASRKKWTKRATGLAVTCLCLLLAAPLVWPPAANLPHTPTEPATVELALTGRQEPSLESTPAAFAPDNGNPGQLEPHITPATEPRMDGASNGTFLPSQDAGNPCILNGKPMISGYGDMEPGGAMDKAVADGSVVLSPSLAAAMEAYGETANYRVLVELFSRGIQIPGGGAAALQEQQRLSGLGYVVAMETVTSTTTEGEYITAHSVHHFTLHATLEQLQNFQPSPDLGYCILLYGEYFEGGLVPDTPVCNSGNEPVLP